MTDIKTMISVMHAYAEGKEVEVSARDKNIWGLCTQPLWDWSLCDYRVKPKGMYRPYNSAKECLAGMARHGNWVRSKKGTFYLITEVGKSYVDVNNRTYTMEGFLKDFVYFDDAPCGVKEN